MHHLRLCLCLPFTSCSSQTSTQCVASCYNTSFSLLSMQLPLVCQSCTSPCLHLICFSWLLCCLSSRPSHAVAPPPPLIAHSLFDCCIVIVIVIIVVVILVRYLPLLSAGATAVHLLVALDGCCLFVPLHLSSCRGKNGDGVMAGSCTQPLQYKKYVHAKKWQWHDGWISCPAKYNARYE